MRTLNPTIALASFVGFLTAASCTLITDVDRTKIPTDAGAEGGAPGTGGTSGTGGKGGTSGKGGTGGDAGAGTGGGGTGGTGNVEPECKHATGSITLNPDAASPTGGTLFADGETITIGDGVNAPVVFEFDLLPSDGLDDDDHVAIAFDGTENNYGLAALIAEAINDEGSNLLVVAGNVDTDPNAPGAGGAAGASGQGGEAGGSVGGAGSGGEGGATGGTGGGPIPPGAVRIELSNELAGALGNVRIRETAGNPNLKVAGMSGGLSVQCEFDSSCTSAGECASGDCGDDNLCVQ